MNTPRTTKITHPADYICANDWSFSEIKATAERGVSAVDAEQLEETDVTEEQLEAWCRARVREADVSARIASLEASFAARPFARSIRVRHRTAEEFRDPEAYLDYLERLYRAVSGSPRLWSRFLRTIYARRGAQNGPTCDELVRFQVRFALWQTACARAAAKGSSAWGGATMVAAWQRARRDGLAVSS